MVACDGTLRWVVDVLYRGVVDGYSKFRQCC